MKSRLIDWSVLAVTSLLSVLLVWLPVGFTRVYENFDGPYYLVVAASWYDKEFIGRNFSFNLPLEYYAAHLPGYPLLINLFSKTGLVNNLQAMLLVNLISSAALTIVFFEIAKRMKLSHPLFLSSALLFFWPRMWAVRSVGSPETLFMLFVLGSLYWFEKKSYWLAGLAGAAAVLTKSPGVLLLGSYLVWAKLKWFETKKFDWKIWPILLIPLAGLGLFWLYQIRMGDFWAYFNSGDNIHLQFWPFRIFDSAQAWVGSHWLEDVLWIYLVSAVGVWMAFKKSRVFGLFGLVYLASILFVSHRDIARYSLPLVPIVLIGLSDILKNKTVRWILVLLLVPAYFYTLNFLNFNYSAIADWTPFL